MKMADVKQPVKEGFSKAYENVQDKVTEKAQYAARTTDDWVHENPWQAIAIVAVTSLILGKRFDPPAAFFSSEANLRAHPNERKQNGIIQCVHV